MIYDDAGHHYSGKALSIVALWIGDDDQRRILNSGG